MTANRSVMEAVEEAVRAEDFDRALDLLEEIAVERPLSTPELVKKGRWILLSTGRPGRQPQDALRLFESVLSEDGNDVAALTEIGWYCYAVEDDARRARDYFSKAVDVTVENLRVAVEGLLNCIRETEGDEAVQRELEALTRRLLELEGIRAALLPAVPPDEAG